MKSSRISRVMQILTTLQAGKGYAVSDMSKMFGTSRRTLFRDLKELRAVGVPFRYDTGTGGYTIEPEFFLPPLDLNLQEALSLLLLVYNARNQIQLPFKNSALLAALKIENNLPFKIRQYCNTALQNVSAKPVAQAPTKLLDMIFAQLQKAITKKHKVNIRYNSLFEGEVIELHLNPYHLLYNQRAWYVLGFSNMHKSIRTFKLNRICELNNTEQCFLGGENFDLSDYFGKAWSMIPEGRVYNIKLRFLPKVANNVTEVQWHDTQQVTRNSDGSATVEFRVDGLGEITWWILGYGDQVQVLAPKSLRKRVVEKAKNMIKLNEQI
ncbi:MAG: WYL domain-containing transcriptional regulator [Planctomycetes bacterium]|nr:WYL domain-containing transcriptional regulator [Planctomycetota bacterium]